MNNKVSFWQFIADTALEIPIIQRDYAQGREGKEYLRKTFLAELKKALDGSQDLKLDFVYGAMEGGKMQPLDGQQRLTTLWLLHWYIALRAGKLKEAVGHLEKFTYETRLTSREFFTQLCKPESFERFADSGKGIVQFIESQTWFYTAWKQDPTIQSLLRMLSGTTKNDDADGLELIFVYCQQKDFEQYWEKLTSEEAPISIYQLPLHDFGLSDDLYIKMNARGKQLTMFENFKANLVGYIREQAKKHPEWKQLLDLKQGIPLLLDSKWMEIFWNYRSEKGQVDEIYYAFMNRFFLNYHINATEIDDKNPYYRYLTRKEEVVLYEGIENYYWQGGIKKELFDDLKRILAEFSASGLEEDIFNSPYGEKFYFIPHYKDGNLVQDISLQGRVVFHAICKFFKQGGVKDETDKQQLKRWMRFVWNLISVQATNGEPLIRNIESVKNAVAVIDAIEDSHDVFFSLTEYRGTTSTGLGEQLEEEIEKAKIVQNDPQWERKLIDAEKFAFFKGCIRFLLRDRNGEWTTQDFDTKWSNVCLFFNETGVKDSETVLYKSQAILLKALLYYIEDWMAVWGKDLYILSNAGNTWRNRFLSSRNWAKAVHKVLMGNYTISERVEDDEIYRTLYTTCLLDYVVDKFPDSRVVQIQFRGNNRWAIYQRYGRDGIILDSREPLFRRNCILAQSENEKRISVVPGFRVPGCDIFKGWKVPFTYEFDGQKFNFVFSHDNKVYRQNEAGKDIGDVFAFDCEKEITVDAFCARLDEFLKEEEKEEE